MTRDFEKAAVNEHWARRRSRRGWLKLHGLIWAGLGVLATVFIGLPGALTGATPDTSDVPFGWPNLITPVFAVAVLAAVFLAVHAVALRVLRSPEELLVAQAGNQTR